jgi:acyl-CoA synthetase (NDP forming)
MMGNSSEKSVKLDLNYLMRPKSVAVVGATEKPGFGGATCANLLKSNLGEKLYFVNPRRDEVLGKKCFKSVSDIPESIDMVVICTPRSTVNGILEEAAARGAKAAVIYASGYGETGPEGVKAEKELREVALRLGIAVCGPNCAGYINNIDNIWSFGIPISAPAKKVMLVYWLRAELLLCS